MMLKDLVLKNRSYRGFDESVRISRETLEGFVDCARLCPSSVNKQPLKYFLADRKSTRLNSSHVSESRMPSSA